MHRLAAVTPSAVPQTTRHWSSSANGSGEASRHRRRCVSSSTCGRGAKRPWELDPFSLEQESMAKRLIVLAASVLLVGAVGCGSSSHRRADAVLDRAEAAIAEIHALHDEANDTLVEQHEGRPERCPETGWSPEVFLGFGIPRETRDAMSEAENRLRVCRGELASLNAILSESQADVDRYDVERLTGTIERLRTELEDTPSDVLDQIVERAASDEALWLDLYALSSPGAMTAALLSGTSSIPSIDIDAARERVAERTERAQAAGVAVDEALEQLAAAAAHARNLLDG